VSHSNRGPVVIDTSVYSAGVDPRGQRLAFDYRPVLEGRPAVISFVTVAEMRFGSRIASWGARRRQRLEHEARRDCVARP
jgi:predicted nucleic acid-binding protein